MVPPQNVRYRWTGPDGWLENNEVIEFHVSVDPPEAWAAEVWGRRWDHVLRVELRGQAVHGRRRGQRPARPSSWMPSPGKTARGLAFNLWAEDSEPTGDDGDRASSVVNDMTTRGPEGSARQYYAHALLLRMGEYAAATSVEESTWAQNQGFFSATKP